MGIILSIIYNRQLLSTELLKSIGGKILSIIGQGLITEGSDNGDSDN